MRLFGIGIVGGGPAGLSAALWGARYGNSVVVLDSGATRNWESCGINGYLQLASVRPAELRGRWRDEFRVYGVTLIDAEVTRLVRDQSGESPTAPDEEPRFVLERHDGACCRRAYSEARYARILLERPQQKLALGSTRPDDVGHGRVSSTRSATVVYPSRRRVPTQRVCACARERGVTALQDPRAAAS